MLNDTLEIAANSANNNEHIVAHESSIDDIAKKQTMKGNVNMANLCKSHQNIMYERVISNLQAEINFLRRQLAERDNYLMEEINFLRKQLETRTRKHGEDDLLSYVKKSNSFQESCNKANVNNLTDTDNNTSVETKDPISGNPHANEYPYLSAINENQVNRNGNNVNDISNNENKINDQLQAVRKKIHRDFVNNKDSQSNKKDDKIPDNKMVMHVPFSPQMDNPNHLWSKGTWTIVGDSIISGLDEKLLSKKNPVKVRSFPGSTVEDMFFNLVPIMKKKPDFIILHVGTNDAANSTSKSNSCKASLTVRKLRELIVNLNIDVVDNVNIVSKHLGVKGLHLKPNGTGRLALNFKQVIQKF